MFLISQNIDNFKRDLDLLAEELHEDITLQELIDAVIKRKLFADSQVIKELTLFGLIAHKVQRHRQRQ